MATHTSMSAASPVQPGSALAAATTAVPPSRPKKFTFTGWAALRSTLLSLAVRLSQATVTVSPILKVSLVPLSPQMWVWPTVTTGSVVSTL